MTKPAMSGLDVAGFVYFSEDKWGTHSYLKTHRPMWRGRLLPLGCAVGAV